MNLPEKRAVKRAESRDLVRPIIEALNHLDGVRVVRNNNLGPVVPYAKRFTSPPIVAGLGAGSADIVGIVSCMFQDQLSLVHWSTGRVFALEVKQPKFGKLRKGTVKSDQERWLQTVRRFGGFAAVVHSVEEAVACVASCRRGESGELPF